MKQAGNWGKFPHPLIVAESFTPHAKSANVHTINFPTLGLIKFLLYGDYLRAKASSKSTSVKSVVQKDLDKYLYKKKDRFEVLYALLKIEKESN